MAKERERRNRVDRECKMQIENWKGFTAHKYEIFQHLSAIQSKLLFFFLANEKFLGKRNFKCNMFLRDIYTNILASLKQTS